MLSENLQKAVDSIRAYLVDLEPVSSSELFSAIEFGENVRNIDLREGIWLLIGKGEVALTSDLKVVLAC